MLLQPEQRVVAQKLPDLAAPIIRPRVAPRCLTPPVIVEIDPAMAVLVPAVELPEVEVVGSEMVVDDVIDDCDPAAMRRIHERLKSGGPAIIGFDREQIRRIVSERAVPRKLVRRHHLNHVDPKIDQIVELADDGREIATPVATAGIVEKAADMQLVDDHLVPGRRSVALRRPRKSRRRDDGIPG